MPAESPATPPKMRRVLLFIGVFAIGAVGLAVSGIMDRAKSRQEVAAWTNAQTIPMVRVAWRLRRSSFPHSRRPGHALRSANCAFLRR